LENAILNKEETMLTMIETSTVNSVSQLIQLSVAPVFLLAGVAGLLNVFTGRLSRIIDKVDKLDKYEDENQYLDKEDKVIKKIEQRREFLTMRMKNTNLAILFCTCTGLLIALVIVTMFLSAIFEFKDSFFIAILFIAAMLCLISSLFLFLREIFYTTSFIKSKKSYIP
jgi:magnesium-transporting ATPase (P-type)